MENMNDITFVNNHCELIGDQYEEAKNLYLDAPIQTLVILRSLIATLCNTIFEELCLDVETKDVFESINSIEATTKLDRKIINKLHEIRLAGNKAAHKEQYNLKKDDLITLALKTLQDFCELINLIRVSFQRVMTPSYSFDTQIQSSLKELSYKALFDNEPNAKYVIGCALVQMHYRRLNDFFNPEINNESCVLEDVGHLNRGVDLIESAAIYDGHLESMHEYAVILVSGTEREKDVNKGIAYFRRAGYEGHISARAYYGYYIVNSGSLLEFEIEEALDNLEIAASHYNPVALDTLSVLYREGRHVSKDIDKSVEYLKKAALAGYPESQYKLANYYYSTCKDHSLYITDMTEVARNGYPPAFLSLARTHAKKANTVETSEVAVKAYEKYLALKADPIAQFELGSLILKFKVNDVDRIKTALTHFINCYRSNDCPNHIAKQVEVSSKKALDNLGNEMRSQRFSVEKRNDILAIFLYFDSNGKPFKTEEMMENINSVLENPKSAHDFFFVPSKNNVKPLEQKIGRNDVCPHCSSGKKYKKCCGK